MLKKVISGGQTGADRIGLEVAKKLGIPTGGMVPKNWWTENGKDETLRDFGMTESTILGYTNRTMYNLVHSDGTVLFGDMSSAGSHQTVQGCLRNGRPYITNPLPDELADWIASHNIETLNVAGNRGSLLSPVKQAAIRDCLYHAFILCGY